MAEEKSDIGQQEVINSGHKIKKILVIEDDKDVSLIIVEYLRQQGYEVFVADSGLEGLKKAIILKPDLITLDLLMPKMDGYFVTRLLKQHQETKHIPIIIVSAVFEKDKCLRLGIADYITKPFSSESLKDAIIRAEKLANSGASGKKVLIVDDDPDMVSMLTSALTERGYIVCSAKDGIQGILAAKKEKPNLILLDLNLPFVDGFSVMKALKDDPGTAPIPIIVITARSIEDKEKVMRLGANEYLIKPFTMRILYEELDKIIESDNKRQR